MAELSPSPGGGAVVLVPAYNEAAAISSVLSLVGGIGLPVIVIDDGSTDDTAAIAERSGAEIIRHARNLGKGASLYDGLKRAAALGASFVVTIDADGQHRAEDIPRLLARAGERVIVIGSRAGDRDRIPKYRYRANVTANFFVSWAAGHWIDDTQCGLRVYPISLLSAIKPETGKRRGFVFESDVLISACRDGFRTVAVPIPAIYDAIVLRPSHFKPVRDVAAIVVTVAGRLIARALYPSGLRNALKEKRAGAEFSGAEQSPHQYS